MLPEFDIRPGIATLPASPIVEIANYGRSLGRSDLIPLWFGEGDVPTPAPIVEAGVKGLRDGRVFYTVQRGLPELRAALSGYLGRVHGVSVPVERITVTGSGMQAIMVAAQMLVGPGDEMAVVSPVWPNISAAVGVAGGTAVQVPMTLGNQGWTLDLEALFAACGPRTKAIFVNSPGNPTGWVMEKADMARLMEFARSRGLWVVSDEVYARLVYDRPAAPSFLEVSEPDDRLIVINSFSKNWSMTGWRLGWMVTPARLGPVLENLIQFSNSGVAEFVQLAGLTAIEQGEPFVAELVERCRAARDQVMAILGSLPRVRVQPPAGAFYAFFQVEGEPDSMALARRIIDEAGVGLAPGTAFGAGGDGALRLCFASRLESLKTALARMAPVLS
ncbi:pyridoxal phosphate-dependent aminotransferase [Azospirillum sp. RWY-5-1]|uniref:Aminotransferase n=1 Tax=Azospirillum oleiclasticum TaxID=2735135 RepID=A0ABX2TF67_9PROT|nr:pyridoxal phosphate-dependent aminotransferase [Azospirillum oleiclasticum]NYZ15244.1 pyridoxal phosphate-dependent aminotransferase [Azospirillum oleiclasticum]NYZ21335.1 pyridoxal phosphate-dependent aminotransferase [Azospirillum oleiclasticum]